MLYICREHGKSFHVQQATSISTRVITGDVVQCLIVEPSFWTFALRIYLQSESYQMLEREFRATTSARLAAKVRQHPGRDTMTDGMAMSLHKLLLQVVLETPSRQLLKKMLWWYAQRSIFPRVPTLALPLVAAYGAILSMDFSACDCRQLRTGPFWVADCI